MPILIENVLFGPFLVHKGKCISYGRNHVMNQEKTNYRFIDPFVVISFIKISKIILKLSNEKLLFFDDIDLMHSKIYFQK